MLDHHHIEKEVKLVPTLFLIAIAQNLAGGHFDGIE
jgi:hypothetical protein